MEGFWIALIIVVLFLFVVVFLVLNNTKNKEFHNEHPFTVHKIEAPERQDAGFLTSHLEPYTAEQLISIKKVEPKFEFGENSRSQPLARDGDYASEKSYSSKHEKYILTDVVPQEMDIFNARSEKSEKDPNSYSKQPKEDSNKSNSYSKPAKEDSNKSNSSN